MRAVSFRLVWLLLAIPVLVAQEAAPPIPSPESTLGFKPGTDGRLATYPEVVQYFRALDAASDRVQLEVAGKTTEGRDLVLAVISSPGNLARLDELRAINDRLADPTQGTPEEVARWIATGKVFVLVNSSIHSSEIGPTQAAMNFAHFLATTDVPEWVSALENVVIVQSPCHNPDGYVRFVSWWKAHHGDPKTRNAPMPWLYHRYVGHDNNRDWFMLTQAESITTVLGMHRRFRPQIVVDQHQMGAGGARMFHPPYQEPYEPNVSPLLKQGLEELGSAVRQGLLDQGLHGAWSRRQFDAWSPSRAYMHYHGGVRFLTEVASADGADPIERQAPPRGAAREASADQPMPWKGGRWALADVLRYTEAAARLVVLQAAQTRGAWLERFRQVHVQGAATSTTPAAYVIAGDTPRLAALGELLRILDLGEIAVEFTTEACTIDGRQFPIGSPIVRRGQRFYPWVQALFESTPYPEIRTENGALRRPYDVTAHNLALLMDLPIGRAVDSAPASAPDQVRAGSLRQPPEFEVMRSLRPFPWRLSAADEASHRVAREAAQAGLRVGRRLDSTEGAGYGDFEITPSDASLPTGATPVRPARVGLYVSHLGTMDEGWWRSWFDAMGWPFILIQNHDLRSGDLIGQVEVLLLGDLSRQDLVLGREDPRVPAAFRGGIGEDGISALRVFVQSGGGLVAAGDSSGLAIEVFDLPVERRPTRNRVLTEESEAEPAERFNIPGSSLWAERAGLHPLTAGIGPQVSIFWSGSRAFVRTRESADLVMPLRYPATGLRAAGWAEGENAIAGSGAMATVKVGEGSVTLFGFRPHFRRQSWSSFRLMLNSFWR